MLAESPKTIFVDAHPLKRLVRHWKMERLRWLRAKKQPMHSDTFKDHAQCYADVYQRCAKELKECVARMPNDLSSATTPSKP
jgi:hypothetical protein